MPLIYLWMYSLEEGLTEGISSMFDETSKNKEEDGDRQRKDTQKKDNQKRKSILSQLSKEQLDLKRMSLLNIDELET